MISAIIPDNATEAEYYVSIPDKAIAADFSLKSFNLFNYTSTFLDNASASMGPVAANVVSALSPVGDISNNNLFVSNSDNADNINAAISCSKKANHKFMLSVYYQNVRGLRTKANKLLLSTATCDFDIVALTETWLHATIFDSELFGPDFILYRCDRDADNPRGKRGGGVLLAIRNCSSYSCEQIFYSDKDINVDIVFAKILLSNSRKIYVCCLYIPSDSTSSVYELYLKHLEWFRESSSLDASDVVIVLGDFNLPYLEWIWDEVDKNTLLPVNVVNCAGLDLVYGMQSFGLYQINSVRNFNDRTLDLVFCNECDDATLKVCADPLLQIDMHHPALEMLLDCGRTNDSIFSVNLDSFKVFNFRRANFFALNRFLLSIDWNQKFINCSDDCDAMVDILYNVFLEGFQLFVPKNKLRATRHPPWYSRKLLSLKNRKQKAYCRYKLSRSIDHYNEYAVLRRQFASMQADLYKKYITDIQDDLSGDPSKLWSYVNVKKKVANFPKCLIYKGSESNKESEACNLFASFFKSVYVDYDDENSSSPSFNLSQVIDLGSVCLNLDDTLFGLKTLDPKGSCGPDGVSPLFLKSCAGSLALPLVIVFQKSLSTGVFPRRWKTSHIIPIWKSGSRKNVENYRGIAILPTLGKLFESLVCNEIKPIIQRVIVTNQHGFSKGRSTTTNLLHFTSHAIAVLESRAQLDVVYTDFSKAFDKVRLKFLILKLSELGFHSSLLRWLSSYLIGRLQYVNVNGWKSKLFHVPSGVPQGSHLGPVLFNLFINDVVNVFEYADCLLYADDLKLFGTVRSSVDVFRIQCDVNRLSSWCVNNSLSLNVSKCVSVSFYRIFVPIHSSYSIYGDVLKKEDGITDLGVYCDSKLSFRKHIEMITSKAYSMLGFIMRLCDEFTCPRVFKSLYFAYVRSKLEYCSPVWAPHYDNHSDHIEAIQRKFLRFLYRKFGFFCYIEFAPYSFKCSLVRLHSLFDRRRNAMAVFIFDLLSSRIDSNELLSRLKINVPTRNLRHFDFLSLKYHRTNYGRYEPINFMCAIFNSLFYMYDFNMSRDSYRAALAQLDSALHFT